MIDKEQSGVIIKSNVTLKSRGLVPPIDNIRNQYFDVRLNTSLTKEQLKLKQKMMYWAKKVYDERGNPVVDECYKGCQNCGEKNNHCKRPQNKENNH